MKHFLLGLCLFASSLIQAETYNGPTELSNKRAKDIVINGPADLKNIEADTLTVKGPSNFENLTVNESSQFFGPVHGENGRLGNLTTKGPISGKNLIVNKLDVRGNVSVTRMEVKQNAEIRGALVAVDSKFRDLTIYADEIILEDVKMGNLLVKSEGTKVQNLILKGKTVISGNVTFEGGNGVIVKEGTSAIIKGNLQGGKLAN